MTYPFDEWFSNRRKRSGNWFPDINSMMREMEKLMDESLKNFEQPISTRFRKERKLDDVSTVKEFSSIWLFS